MDKCLDLAPSNSRMPECITQDPTLMFYEPTYTFSKMTPVQDVAIVTRQTEHLGISLGGVNYCLRALTDKGMVKIQNFRNSKKRKDYLYLPTPRGISEKIALTESFLKRKINEHEVLKAEIEELKAEFSIVDKPN